MKSLKNTQGFSLVELMVVVAIIGILAALSVGQVQKQIAKSRQSEVKTSLASIYTAEKSLYAEFASYTGDWGQMAFGLEGNVRYNVGFASAVPVLTAAANGYTGTAASGIFAAKAYCAAGLKPCVVINSNGVAPAAPTKNAAAITFIADGHASIYNATDDVWQIDDKKLISNTTPGIP